MGIFADKIRSVFVEKGNAAVFWAGQAGFIIKTDKQKLIALDLYLSDCCERYFGFKRVAPYVLEPYELDFDYVLASHGHYDHFDVDAVPMLLRGDSKFYGAADTKVECDRLGLTKNVNFLELGKEMLLEEGVSVKGMLCDHGELAPDALGLLIKIGDKKIYYMGDTAYREDYFNNPELENTNVLILPINGAFGNMDSKDAVKAAKLINPELSIPCHFWNFAEHGGNPAEFIELMRNEKLNHKLLRIGEGIII